MNYKIVYTYSNIEEIPNILYDECDALQDNDWLKYSALLGGRFIIPKDAIMAGIKDKVVEE